MDGPADKPNQIVALTPEKWQEYDDNDNGPAIDDVATDENTDHHSVIHAPDHVQLHQSNHI